MAARWLAIALVEVDCPTGAASIADAAGVAIAHEKMTQRIAWWLVAVEQWPNRGTGLAHQIAPLELLSRRTSSRNHLRNQPGHAEWVA